ncbi:c-type cytochrome [Ciceribacter thiooxidans]|uniref:C-type cytochrome n=1 Tax=Ciceribacter thiooxidans TaxID=1969821 RepID=A0ABV7I5Z2_9HYPH|nr:cytochrome c family protein [Ciceribacter thiooxidans]MDI6836374.1 cytochrome c family protein [Rhizobiaceae bacterium]
MKINCLVLAAALVLPAGFAAADGDPVAGAKVFKQCAACHTIDGKNKVGPTLQGVVDRPVATVPGFKYSKAMTEFGADGKTWTEDLLKHYLPKPRDLVKGTTMTFAGLKKEDDIKNVIAYLKDPAAAQ